MAVGPVEGLLRPRGAHTHRGHRLTRAEARRIACDCTLRALLTDRQGRPLSIGRATRTVPAHLRDAVTARDRHCAWPGCTRPPTWCETHHLIHWADGGPTSLDNLALLCGAHHSELHTTGWELRMHHGRPVPVPPQDYRPPPNTRHPHPT
ncbi:HNH endonuclease [Streptacidiphilus monticola]